MMVKSSISEPATRLDEISTRIRACRFCRDVSDAAPLPHEPRPVFRVSASARLLVASQAPGLRVHETGLPFNDPSGDRLRQWMGVDRDTFYDEAKIAIVPMGFCFPGYNELKADLPPRRECRARWHDQLFAHLPRVETILAIGRYAQDYHFARLGRPLPKGAGVDAIVRRWREFEGRAPRVFALPHPSWRNSGWLKRNPWFETEVVPVVRAEVARLTRI
jgi:uracil-DNA glycosylase